MEWQFDSTENIMCWSSPEGYQCNMYSPNPFWYAGLPMKGKVTWLHLGAYLTAEEAKAVCEKHHENPVGQ